MPSFPLPDSTPEDIEQLHQAGIERLDQLRSASVDDVPAESRVAERWIEEAHMSDLSDSAYLVPDRPDRPGGDVRGDSAGELGGDPVIRPRR